MYNLTVAHDHTYAVGDTQAVVHNDNCLPPLSQAQKEPGLAQAQQWAEQNGARAGAVAKISGDDEIFSRGFSGEIHPADGKGSVGRFAPDQKLTPYQDAGRGNCAEFYCLGLRHRPNTPIDLFLYHYRGEGPCPACEQTFGKFIQNNNGYPIRAIWRTAAGDIRTGVFS
jgi:hypothetical protein